MHVLKRLSPGNINGKHNSRVHWDCWTPSMKIKQSILLAWDPKSSMFSGLWIWQWRVNIFFKTGKAHLQHPALLQHRRVALGKDPGKAHVVPTLVGTLSNSSPRLPQLNCFPSNHNYFDLHERKRFQYFCKLFFTCGFSLINIKAKVFGVGILLVCLLL